jgi:hypothetical protein
MNDLYRRAEQGDTRGKYAAKVKIRLSDGAIYQSDAVEGNINFPQQGWDEARLESKFRWLSNQVLDESRTNALVDMIWSLDQLADLRQLTRLVA